MENMVETIVSCSLSDLQGGKLETFFRQGAKVAIVEDDCRVRWLWDSLLGQQNGANSGGRTESNPWDISILNVGRNHFPGNVRYGDMLRFIPGEIAHIARKSIVFQDSNKQLKTIPSFFNSDQKQSVYEEKILQTVWDLMQEIFESTLSEKFDPLKYAVTIELLKYHSSQEDLQKMFALLRDSGGYWTALGTRLDEIKSVAAGIFDIRRVKDLFALSSLVPGLRTVLNGINDLIVKSSKKNVPDNFILIGGPHVDGSKVITALLSDRDVLRTEVHSGTCWVPIPLTPDSLAIFPSAQIKRFSKLLSTFHRVLLKKNNGKQEVFKPNITISLAIIPMPQNDFPPGYRTPS